MGTALDEGDVLSSSANNYFKGANGATGPQPDLSWDNATGVWADLTTEGQWANHVSKYGDTFGEGIPLIYSPGQGLTNLTQLTPFLGVTDTSAQALSSLSGDQTAAAGGYLL